MQRTNAFDRVKYKRQIRTFKSNDIFSILDIADIDIVTTFKQSESNKDRDRKKK